MFGNNERGEEFEEKIVVAIPCWWEMSFQEGSSGRAQTGVCQFFVDAPIATWGRCGRAEVLSVEAEKIGIDRLLIK